ncbi:MAG: hypothetical protein EP343_28910 [Deltaproteobacteria bacterium]|nr:MAG: hypothetical protein EP343_28910 [Deltaproteobacteria bacterium]
MDLARLGQHIPRLILVLLLVAPGVSLGWSTGCSPSVSIPESGENEADASTPPEQRNTSSRFVGHTCQTENDCPSGLGCETLIPDGYCTRECTRSADCPGSSLCVRITFSNGQKFLRCVHTCRTAEDCRTNFVCYHPPKSLSQLCLPLQ